MSEDREVLLPPIKIILSIKNDFRVENGTVYRMDGYIGSLNRHGYRQFKIKCLDTGYRYTIVAHHIAWFLYKGEWPSKELDHENRNKEDNSEKNLRLSNSYLQALNRSSSIDKKSGLPMGVKRKGLYYEGYATVLGRKIYVGMSKDPEIIGQKVKDFMKIRNDDSLKGPDPS